MELDKKYIKKGSEIIAKFMGGRFVKKISGHVVNEYHFDSPIIGSVSLEEDKFYNGYIAYDSLTKYRVDEMEYHKSWNLLMPVVKKIMLLMDENNDSIPRSFFHHLPNVEIEETFKGVVEFIEEYNELNKS